MYGARKLCGGVLCLAALALLPACQDREVGPKLAKFSKQQGNLEREIAALKRRNEALEEKMAALSVALNKRLDQRFAEMDEKLAANHAALLALLKSSLQDTRNAGRKLVEERARVLNEKIKDRFSVGVAEEISKVNQRLDSRSAELKAYMRNQLKELYPYAYQPRRMDAATPPEGPQDSTIKPIRGGKVSR